MYRIEAIPEQLGAHYRSESFKTKKMAEQFRTDYLIDPKGTHFRIVTERERTPRARKTRVAK